MALPSVKHLDKNIQSPESDGQASSRKQDHIELAFSSSTLASLADDRFYYEPMLSGHPSTALDLSTDLCGRQMQYPLWVSSMTGGTEKARIINHNLAKVCGNFGLGMGLGSCRQLLNEDKRLEEFDIRGHMPDSPLLINLGIAQVETLLSKSETARISDLIGKLSADGLIIHVNPLQEWLQPEGDHISQAPLTTISRLMEVADYPIVVKEVGQGFGKKSLEALLDLPLAAVDLAGFGGTNFSKLELKRTDKQSYDALHAVSRLGHSCQEMIDWVNVLSAERAPACKKIIISGGIKNFLDGYHLMQKCKLPSIYAQASGFLQYATDYDALTAYCRLQIEGLRMAHAFLRLKEDA